MCSLVLAGVRHHESRTPYASPTPTSSRTPYVPPRASLDGVRLHHHGLSHRHTRDHRDLAHLGRRAGRASRLEHGRLAAVDTANVADGDTSDEDGRRRSDADADDGPN